MSVLGTIAFGVRTPILKRGDDLVQNVVDSVVNAYNEAGINPSNGDIIGITESIVARTQGNYASVDEIGTSVYRLFYEEGRNDVPLLVYCPIYSRNRFATCLRGIAKCGKPIYLLLTPFDEVGNPLINHPFTKMNYDEYYRYIVTSETGSCEIFSDIVSAIEKCRETADSKMDVLVCTIHNRFERKKYLQDNLVDFDIDARIHTLDDVLNDRCEYGLLGSNKASDNSVKLFPNIRKARQLVYRLQEIFDERLGAKTEIMIYGDGAFKSPYDKGVSIWELADPVVSVANTDGLNRYPNEVKIKYLADNEFADKSGEDLSESVKTAIKKSNLEVLNSDMSSEGVTPRRVDFLAGSLMDLISGSGSKGTPIVVIHNNNRNYGEE